MSVHRPALAPVLVALTGQWGPSHSATPWDRHDVSLVLPDGPRASSTFDGTVVPFGGAQ